MLSQQTAPILQGESTEPIYLGHIRRWDLLRKFLLLELTFT